MNEEREIDFTAPEIIPAMPEVVGRAYLKHALNRAVGYKVHESAVNAAIYRADFPPPVYDTETRNRLRLAERLFYRFDVDAWLDTVVADRIFIPRPAADIKRAFGGNRTPTI